MENKQIITEINRIKQLMVINEQLAPLIVKIFGDTGTVTSMIGGGMMQSLRTNINNLVTTFAQQQKYLPRIGDNETIPDYMIRIANDRLVNDEVLETVYKIFPDYSPGFQSLVNMRLSNEIINNPEITNAIAKTMDTEQLKNYLKNTLKINDENEIKRITDEVGKIRAKMPIETTETVKVAGLKKWLVLPREVDYTGIIRMAEEPFKKVLQSSQYKSYFQDIDFKKPFQEYTNELIKDINNGINAGSIKTEVEAEAYILAKIQQDYKDFQKIPNVKQWYQKMMPQLPRTKVVDGQTIRPTLYDWLKFNAKLGVPLTIFVAIEEIKAWENNMTICTEEESLKDHKKPYSTLKDEQKKEITTKCKQSVVRGSFGTTLLVGITGPVGAMVYSIMNQINLDIFGQNEAWVESTNSNTTGTTEKTFTNDATGFENFLKVEYKKPDGSEPIFNDADREVMKNEGDNKWSFVPFINNKDQPKRTWEFKNGNFVEITI